MHGQINQCYRRKAIIFFDNNSVINVYIDSLIASGPDYFNEDKLESLKKQVVDLQMMYNNILRHNISTIIL